MLRIYIRCTIIDRDSCPPHLVQRSQLYLERSKNPFNGYEGCRGSSKVAGFFFGSGARSRSYITATMNWVPLYCSIDWNVPARNNLVPLTVVWTGEGDMHRTYNHKSTYELAYIFMAWYKIWDGSIPRSGLTFNVVNPSLTFEGYRGGRQVVVCSSGLARWRRESSAGLLK